MLLALLLQPAAAVLWAAGLLHRWEASWLAERQHRADSLHSNKMHLWSKALGKWLSGIVL